MHMLHVMLHEKGLLIMTVSGNFREIVLDTETTGLNWEDGDRIVDLACVELVNHIATGNSYQTHINPQKNMSSEAVDITGITDDFLMDKPLFCEIADDFLNFVCDAKLIIHNAQFDINFLNSELARINKPLFSLDQTIDTLEMAKKMLPKSQINLNALCKKFNINTSHRSKHGALVDCFLLAEVYLHLLGGRQEGLSFGTHDQNNEQNVKMVTKFFRENPQRRLENLNFAPTAEELSFHAEFLKSIKSPLWLSSG
jgi:DNA polymerase-3 subunit epsilon